MPWVLVAVQHAGMESTAVEESIIKAKKAFFAMGCIWAYQALMRSYTPLNSRWIFEMCVLVLLYGCENWILYEQDILLLEKFRDDMEKRMLMLPRHHTNTITRTLILQFYLIKKLANLLTKNV